MCLEISSTHCWAMGAGEIIRVAGDGMAGCNQIKKFVPACINLQCTGIQEYFIELSCPINLDITVKYRT